MQKLFHYCIPFLLFSGVVQWYRFAGHYLIPSNIKSYFCLQRHLAEKCTSAATGQTGGQPVDLVYGSHRNTLKLSNQKNSISNNDKICVVSKLVSVTFSKQITNKSILSVVLFIVQFSLKHSVAQINVQCRHCVVQIAVQCGTCVSANA